LINYVPAQVVVKFKVRDKTRLMAEDFEHLSAALFIDLELKFLVK
jgi:hypothetical protein